MYRFANGSERETLGSLRMAADERWLVFNAKVSIKPCLHGVYRLKCSKRLKAFLVLHVSGVCCTGRERCLTIACYSAAISSGTVRKRDAVRKRDGLESGTG